MEGQNSTYLRDKVKVGNKSRVKDDWHVGGVEELNWIRTLLPTGILGPHWQNHAEPLEVDNN